LSQFTTIRRAHTLERRSIGLKVRPLLHQNPEMIQELLPFLYHKKKYSKCQITNNAKLLKKVLIKTFIQNSTLLILARSSARKCSLIVRMVKDGKSLSLKTDYRAAIEAVPILAYLIEISNYKLF
jgi:hypothetical protein